MAEHRPTTNFVLLADRPEALPTVAEWYFQQWGTLVAGDSVANTSVRLRSFLNRDTIPLIMLAVEGGDIVGAAQLKLREMDIYPERTYWLGGVYVHPAQRGKDIGTQLIQRVTDIARSLQVDALHLQTERLNGRLYARLGWQARERVCYKGVNVLVMDKVIDGTQ